MNLKMKSVCARRQDDSEVWKSLTEKVNIVRNEIDDDQSLTISYEQSRKSNHPDNQYFYAAAFIHYTV